MYDIDEAHYTWLEEKIKKQAEKENLVLCPVCKEWTTKEENCCGALRQDDE